ncbi:hypothetical protein [Rhizobium phaseoli]|uniref:hypothetical protein n=1 Tax=Rhizobium phaseoli TaxID=396 RepID=UPI00143854A0|nr:hypothetical protein [Rhizobium phaseoli]MDK4730603.1 hypothetical protein [Rhizobium phaseoli]NKE91849.1 hypothetical protein [Rhizobium phaseoli]
MTPSGFQLRHLVFLGPNRPPAVTTFGPGLNIIYGASDTGKSFLVEAIDFMLGSKGPLRDLPERVGYDRILLGLESLAGEKHTLFRSTAGGRFKVYPGLIMDDSDTTSVARELSEVHSDRNSDNLSMFLLGMSDLAGKRVRKNKRGETNSLSFRNLARLLIVTETEITDQRSPLSDGNPTADTPNFATFKLMLTGVDDSSLVSSAPVSPEDQTREAQIELLDQLIGDYRERLKALTKTPKELEDQLQRIDDSMMQHAVQLASSDADFRVKSLRRRELRERFETESERRSEVQALLERFSLLNRHYDSDVARLKGIEETGTLFVALGQASCPLCGASPEHHKNDGDCEGNVDAVVIAARSEIAKIALLRAELAETIETLQKEAQSLDRTLPRVDQQLVAISSEIDSLVSPQLTRLRATYKELADKRGDIREALSMLRTLEDAQNRRAELDRQTDDEKSTSVAEGDLPVSIADSFARHIETILKDWHFPGGDRVSFDPKARDLVIGGKLRTARGKGLRAITHAAFTIGLLEFSRTAQTPHPGFVVLDSPLLAYRAPDGTEDDLSGTDLKERFYNYLHREADDRQTIIVENDDPPESIRELPQVIMFSGNPHSGRFGLFPVAGDQGSSNSPEPA